MAAKPTILAVDDDPVVSRAVTRDLRARYGHDYRVLSATSGDEALQLLAELALRDRPIALVASDQRMPRMTGIEVLAEVRRQSPDTKLLLLTAYADTDVAIEAINEIGLDYYLLKPWDPPEERLYPVIDDLLGDWSDDHPDRDSMVRVVGHPWSDQTADTKTFLARNHVPYRWLDIERDDEARQLVELAGAEPGELPLVLVPDGETLRAPSAMQLAEALGLRTKPEQPLYDLAIVGAGPAGLAAAVYAASEGLRTVVVERDAPGGQAGTSASIENYLGFPKGLSGADLTRRAVAQASRFGAEMVLARDVVGFEERGPVRAVLLEGGGEIEARALLITTGVSYRRLEAEGVTPLGSRGVNYGATASEAAQCQGEEVYVVGAANSAGQAVLNLARFAKKVVLLVRGERLEDSMSSLPGGADPGGRQRRGAAPHDGRERKRRRPPGAAPAVRRGTQHGRGGGHELAVRLHRGRAAHGLAGRRGRPRRQGLPPHRTGAAGRRAGLAAGAGAVRPGDQRAGRLRCR